MLCVLRRLIPLFGEKKKSLSLIKVDIDLLAVDTVSNDLISVRLIYYRVNAGASISGCEEKNVLVLSAVSMLAWT